MPIILGDKSLQFYANAADLKCKILTMSRLILFAKTYFEALASSFICRFSGPIENFIRLSRKSK